MSATYFLLYILIGVISVALFYYRKTLHYWKDQGIPHDDPHIIYGNLRGFRKDRAMRDIIIDIYRKYKGTGPFCGLYFFQRPNALILDRELAKNILIRDFSNFADRGIFHNERDDPLTGHLFALDGDKWRQLRHKLSPTFTSGKMKFMFPTVIEVAVKFVHILDELILENNILEIKELLACFTTDVIGTCAFGIECNSLKESDSEFRTMGRRAFKEVRHINIIMAFIQSFPKLARKLHFRSIPEEIHQFFMRIVRETVGYREKNNIKRNDFMDILIELKNKKSIKTEDGEILSGLSIEEVAAQAFVFFLAGFETSSTTMGFALYELARNQDVQDKARKAINENLAKHNQEFTYECIKEIWYLNQIISETLRLYTVVPNLVREALKEYPVPGHPKYVIKKGMQVLIPAAAYHCDQEYYPEPEKFDPDRFSLEMVTKRDSIEWLPFGEGPRNCIGKRFGEMQARIGLAHLIKNFKFSICEKTQIPMTFDPMSFVVNANGGIYLKCEKIK